MIHYEEHALDGDVWVIKVEGELDSYTSSDFFDCLEVEIEKGRDRIIVDCSSLEHVSSAGIAALIRAHAKMKRRGGDVKLAALKGKVAEVLRLTHLDRILGIYPDVRTAHQAFDA